MITVRNLKLTIVWDEETRNQLYKIIRDEQYQQYRALNLCMSLLNTHNILNTIAVFTKYSLTFKLLVIKYWLKKSINIKYIPS